MRSNTRLAVESKNIAPFMLAAPDMSHVCELKSEHESEVLEFLGIRPVHTVVMTSFIRDNGIVSSLNRGTFYGYRNAGGRLDAVALIGHSTLVEARTDESLQALAHVARTSVTPIHLIMSAGDVATAFWNYAYGTARTPSLTCTELLFEIGFPFLVQECEYDVRLARPDELEIVAEAHAEVAEIECGVNPMLRDREGFLKRVASRIERGRVFVVFDKCKLVFKADVIAETDSVAYLEGVWVGEEYRGQGNCSEMPLAGVHVAARAGGEGLLTEQCRVQTCPPQFCESRNAEYGCMHNTFCVRNKDRLFAVSQVIIKAGLDEFRPGLPV